MKKQINKLEETLRVSFSLCETEMFLSKSVRIQLRMKLVQTSTNRTFAQSSVLLNYTSSVTIPVCVLRKCIYAHTRMEARGCSLVGSIDLIKVKSKVPPVLPRSRAR